MKDIIKKFYLFPFVGFLILFTLIVIGAVIKSGFIQPVYWYFAVAISGALFLAVLIGTVTYYKNDKIGPNRRQKFLLMSPFTDLFANGFTLRDDAAVGIIKGYTVIVGYEWNPEEHFDIKVLFDPIFKDNTFTPAEQEKHYNIQIYNTKKNTTWIRQTLFWGQCFMSCEMKLGFKLPKYEKVNKEINLMIDILQKGDLKPVGLEFYEKSFPIHLYD